MKDIALHSVKLSNGETIGYRKVGEGDKVLVLIHGNMSTSKHWDTVMESMPKEYTTYGVDLRGFGKSTYHTRINSLKDFSEDLKLFAEMMKLDKFSLAGWSAGGGIVMQFVIDYPEYIEELILVESIGIKGFPIFKVDEKGESIHGELMTTKEEIRQHPIRVLPMLKAYEEKDKEFIRMVWDSLIFTVKKPEDYRYDKYLEETLTQRNLVDMNYSLVHFNISDEHNGAGEGSGEVHEIKVPTLVIQGEKDVIISTNIGIDTAEAIGENATLKLLDNIGHSPMIDDLDGFMNLIISFMD